MPSSMGGNRGTLGSKRSRNDSSPKEGDWICPKCGNMNFAFRTVCNRGKCGAPRPKFTPDAPYSSPFNQPPIYYFGGVGPAPLMTHGMVDRYGPPLPLPGLHYDYGALASPHRPCGIMTTLVPGTLGGISYAAGHTIQPYGYVAERSPYSGQGVPESSPRKRRGGPDGFFKGDWVCPKCENVNFAFRTTCNLKKCGAAKPAAGPNQSESDVLEGSWTCNKCDNLNYHFRTVCNRKGCGNEKPASDD